jgi:hypothetical protein
MTRRVVLIMAAALWSLVAPELATAQLASASSVSAADRDALVALHVGRGGRPEDLDVLIRFANEAGAKGLPVRPLADKIREGVSKRAAPARIEAVLRQMAADLAAADQIARDWAPGSTPPARERAVTLLAEALGQGLTPEEARRGLTPEEARALGRHVQAATAPTVSVDLLANAAKGLAFIKDAQLPVPDGTVLVAEAARQGYRAYDLLDLGRQIKLRERDYQSGRATLAAVRDAVARGERPERIFRDERAGRVERPTDVRAPTRPERPVRPERVGRP